MKELSCGVIVPGCSAKFAAESEDEILQQVTIHAREDHGIDEVSPELEEQVRAEIVER